jgi:hypothetical protein
MVRRVVLYSLLQKLKILFTDPAVRTQPILGYILPTRTRRYAVIRPAFGFVIDESTDDTFPFAHG